jgi:hypothetical protein
MNRALGYFIRYRTLAPTHKSVPVTVRDPRADAATRPFVQCPRLTSSGNGWTDVKPIIRGSGSAFVTMLLTVALDAGAQTAPVAEQPAASEGQLVVPSLSIEKAPSPPTSNGQSLWVPRADRFTWGGGVSGRASGTVMSPSITDNAQAWRATTSVSYMRGNFTVGAGLHGHHGYQLPSSMSFALGETSASDFRPPGFVDATGSRVWEARLMLKARLFGRQKGLRVDGVAEAFLPLDRDLARPAVPGSFMPIESRALRFGIVVSF